MTYESHVNVICSMLYQRGDRLRTPGLRTVSRSQVARVVEKYNLRERTSFTVRETLSADTARWSIEPTMTQGRYLISQKDPSEVNT